MSTAGTGVSAAYSETKVFSIIALLKPMCTSLLASFDTEMEKWLEAEGVCRPFP